MNTILFSFDGGYPLTQDDLDYLQQAYIECFNAINAVVDSTTPILLSGMSQSSVLGVTTVAPGYFLYNGKIIHFTGGTFSALGIRDVVLVVITTTATDLTYDDGSINPAIVTQTGGITVAPPVTDATHFPLNAMISYATAFALASNSSVWIGASSPAYGGTYIASGSSPIKIRKNVGSNRVKLCGITNNSAGASSVGSSQLLLTLPVGERPTTNRYFQCRGTNAAAFANIAIDVLTTGAVNIRGDLTPFDNQGVSMDGIEFDTDI